MEFFKVEKPEYLEKGERARLIPVISDSGKEGKIASVFLATLMAVPDYSRSVFDSIGISLGKNFKIFCYTEVVISNKNNSNIRPDGLIVIDTGRRQWRALVEAKIKNAELNKDQIESYLDLARELKIDHVITISNQLDILPVNVNGQKLRSVSLSHWSWAYLMTEALMWVKHHQISDADQAYILEELVRFLVHDSSGIAAFDRMSPEWKDVAAFVQNRAALNKSSKEVTSIVNSWHQYTLNNALNLSVALGKTVTVSIKKIHKESADKRLLDDCLGFSKEYYLESDFEIPDTASKLKFHVDFKTKSVSASMRLKAPDDKPTSKGKIGWLAQQLKASECGKLTIKAYWPGRTLPTLTTLEKLRENGADVLIDTNDSSKPTSFEIIYAKDLSSKFSGPRTFVQETESILFDFYKEAGQYLKEWTANPPRVKSEKADNVMTTAETLNADVSQHSEEVPINSTLEQS